jgi:hypothetical protein
MILKKPAKNGSPVKLQDEPFLRLRASAGKKILIEKPNDDIHLHP